MYPKTRWIESCEEQSNDVCDLCFIEKRTFVHPSLAAVTHKRVNNKKKDGMYGLCTF